MVHAIDEQSETIDYFLYDKVEAFAKSNQQEARLAAGQAWGTRITAEFEKARKTSSVRELLIKLNAPQRAKEEMESCYYPALAIGDNKNQPGAQLNAGRYQRNAKIFAELNLAAKPSDKILVVFGGGHNYWLRHFVNQMPGYKLVDVNNYLK